MRVLIVGASRGIGAALAGAMRARGDDVLEASRSGGFDAEGDDFEERLRALAGDASLDLLVYNAGLLEDRGKRIGDAIPRDVWARGFAVHVTGPYRAAEAVLPNLRAAKGRIAIVSSQLGSSEQASGGMYVYRASKAAAVNLALNMAADLAPGVAVGAYHPGWVRTDMGGPSAAISPEESAAGLMTRFDALGPDHTGVFETWDGRAHPV